MDCMISKLNKNTHFRCNYKFELQEDKKYFGDILKGKQKPLIPLSKEWFKGIMGFVKKMWDNYKQS